MPTVSVITPVYNIETSLLGRSLFSLMAQTLTDWECVCVNDGSAGSVAEDLDAFIRKDARFRVIHQPNHGVALARQRGMNAVRGDWIAWLDADDYVDVPFLVGLHAKALDAQADMVWSGFYEECGAVGTLKPEICEPIPDLVAERLLDGTLWGGLWNKLFRTDFVRRAGLDFRLYPFPVHEDLCFVIHALGCGARIAYCDTPTYHYCKRDGSILRQSKSAPTRAQFYAAVRVQETLERVSANLDIRDALDRRRQRLKYGWYTLSVAPDSLFYSTYPTVRDVDAIDVPWVHKVLYRLAVRGWRPIIRWAFYLIRRLRR